MTCRLGPRMWRDYWDSGAWVLTSGAIIVTLIAVGTGDLYAIFMAAWVVLFWGVSPVIVLIHDRRRSRR